MEYGTVAILIIQGVVVLLLTFNLRTGKETNKEVGKINGNVGKLAVWAQEHEKKDDERFDIAKDFRRDVWGEVGKIRDKLGTG